MISKELLSVVVPQFNFHDDATTDENYIVFWKDGEMYSDINIYELAHKCKEWAATKNCRIFSEVQYSKHTKGARVEMVVYNGKDQVFISDTEPEAIFKACEWILKEIT